jgi:hypothetical protein
VVAFGLRAQLADAKLDLAKVIAGDLWREESPDDALSFVMRVPEQQHDRLDALARRRAAMTVRRWRGSPPGCSSVGSVTRARSQISEPSR